MKKKRAEKEAGMGYCPFLVLSHDTAGCIMTQGLGGRAWAPMARHARPSRCAEAHSSTPQYGPARARHGAQHGFVSRYKFMSQQGGSHMAHRHGSSSRNTARDTGCDTTPKTRTRPATQRPVRCVRTRHSVVCAQPRSRVCTRPIFDSMHCL